jgi:hypothetical protein
MNKTFAVIKNNLVVNLIVAESLEIAEEVTGSTCIEYYAPKIGNMYSDGQFIPSVVEEETE